MSQKVFISETDEYLFGQGTHYEIYEKLVDKDVLQLYNDDSKS